MYFKTLIIILIQILINQVNSQLEGDNCFVANNTQGKCTNIRQCPKAIEEVNQRINPQICSFTGTYPIVCCAKSKSEEICKKYGKELYEKHLHLIGSGQNAKQGEFPHVAAIGFGTKDNIQWKCGGSLISDKFVLTAAHCLRDQNGVAKFVRMGDINLLRESSYRQDFEIIRRFPHPGYKPPMLYNDIALVELDKSATFDALVKPACLYQDLETKELNEITASGWGLTQYGGNPSDVLQKVSLSLFNNAECGQLYRSGQRRLPNGILGDRMVCAGGRDEEVDTCQGDSGGPFQTYRASEKLYDIIGVTAFRKACGTPNVPSVYSKVAYYVPWIESIVWP